MKRFSKSNMKTIYLSSLLKREFPKTFIDLENTLEDEKNIKLEYLNNTKDIWLRDFMPIKTFSGKYVQYIYEPDYLKDKNFSHLKTNVNEVIPEQVQSNIIHTDIVLDGGNFVRYKKKAILTDKIYKENPKYSNDELNSKIKEVFELEDLIIIPKQPYDIYGHSDSMVRWIDENRVLVNDFQIESKSFNEKLLKALNKHHLEIDFLDYGDSYFNDNRKWAPNMNYLKVGDIILVPVNTLDGMMMFYEKLEGYFPNSTIYFIDCEELIKKGGAIHCITWEVE